MIYVVTFPIIDNNKLIPFRLVDPTVKNIVPLELNEISIMENDYIMAADTISQITIEQQVNPSNILNNIKDLESIKKASFLKQENKKTQAELPVVNFKDEKILDSIRDLTSKFEIKLQNGDIIEVGGTKSENPNSIAWLTINEFIVLVLCKDLFQVENIKITRSDKTNAETI